MRARVACRRIARHMVILILLYNFKAFQQAYLVFKSKLNNQPVQVLILTFKQLQSKIQTKQVPLLLVYQIIWLMLLDFLRRWLL